MDYENIYLENMFSEILKERPNFDNNKLYRNVINDITNEIKRHILISREFVKEIEEHNKNFSRLKNEFDEKSLAPIIVGYNEKVNIIKDIYMRITLLKSIRLEIIDRYNYFCTYAYRERWNFDNFNIEEFRRFDIEIKI
jgi:hypothetical protein